MPKERADFTGMTFGSWKVLRPSTEGYRWFCRCECGTERDVLAQSLKEGRSKCCGCLGDIATGIRAARESRTHGMSKTSTFNIWSGMIDRCYNANCPGYFRYGGRGILICRRWRESFQAFFDDMGERPEGLSLDRIDTNGNYEPNNCRWATAVEQQRNRACNRLVTAHGKTACVAEWSKELGIPENTIRNRLNRGYTGDRAVDKRNFRFKHH